MLAKNLNLSRSFLALSLLGSSLFGVGCGVIKLKPEPPQLNDRVYLLGPEVTPFCGGVVEVWARMDTTSWQRDVALYVKASAGGAGGGWEISNDNLVVEQIQEGASLRKRKLKDIKAIEFRNSHKLDTSAGTNVGRWDLTVEGLDPSTGLKVFFKPFTGCPQGQAITNIVIKDREFY
jgi:hypothetical protein